MNEELKCPFCHGAVHIAPCDDEGNIRSTEYEEDPWSGLGYILIHEEHDAIGDCPIATFDDDGYHLGTLIYDTREEAAEVWNRGCGVPAYLDDEDGWADK